MIHEYVEYDSDYDFFEDDNTSRVFQIFPKVFNDDRGSFTEVLKDHGQWPKDNMPIWLSSMNWMRQINRSVSAPFVCRGMHAQTGIFCQSKLVECIHGQILDFIIDARPNSKTFGLFKAYLLDSLVANKLFLPKGFLHGFYSMKNMIAEDNIFQYYIGGGTFNKESEICVNLSTLLPKIVDYMANEKTPIFNQFIYNASKIQLSDKDKNGVAYDSWMKTVSDEYATNGKLWYK